MALRVIRGNPWHTPRNRRPVCRGCAKPARDAVIEIRPTTAITRDGGRRSGSETLVVFYCDNCGPR